MESENKDGLSAEDIKSQKKQQEKETEKDEIKHERLKAKLYEIEQENIRLKKQNEELKEDKKKPGITNINEDGRERRKRPNTTGLSDMMLPPYQKNRMAIYRIIPHEQINPATLLPVELVPVSIPGRITVLDKFEPDPNKKMKILKNVVGSRSVVNNGKTELEEDVEDILFYRGFLQVSCSDQYPLYVLLERHPNNKSNRFRDRTAPVIFERVDINHSPSAQSAAIELSLDAGNEIRKMKNEDIIAYATSIGNINVAANRPVHEIRQDLIKSVLNDPIGYFKANKDSKAGVKINVLEALNFGLLDYRTDKRGFVYNESDELICTHTASEDPTDKLVKFLTSEDEGKEWYKVMMRDMNYFGEDVPA